MPAASGRRSSSCAQRRRGRPGARRAAVATSGSTSCGSARSTTTSGRPRATSGRRADVRSPVDADATAPVHVRRGRPRRARRQLGQRDGDASTRSARPDGFARAVRLATMIAVDAGRRRVGGGQRGHRAGTDDDEHVARPASPEQPRRAGRGRRSTSGRATPVDVGLGVRPLADPQRLLEERVEGRPDWCRLLAHAQRLADLAEDLALADHHRVEPGGDVKGARRRRPRSARRGGRGGRPRDAGTLAEQPRRSSSTPPWKRSTSA